MASAFLGKYASVTVVDLIQRKKLDSRNFYESNLTEARILYDGTWIGNISVYFRNVRVTEMQSF